MRATPGLFTADDDGRVRCHWCQATPAYRHYHDHEWGFPVTDDRRLFEKLCLEGCSVREPALQARRALVVPQAS